MDLNIWKKHNVWHLTYPVKLSFRISGGINSLIKECYFGTILTKIFNIKEIFPNAEICIWVSSDSTDIYRDYFCDDLIDSVIVRNINVDFFYRFKKLLEKDGENVVFENDIFYLHDQIKFNSKEYIPYKQFFNVVNFNIDWLYNKKINTTIFQDDLRFGNIVPENSIGINYFSNYTTISKNNWIKLIKSLINKGFNVVLFGNTAERIELTDESIPISVRKKAWNDEGLGDLRFHLDNLIESGRVIDLIGNIPDIRKLIVCCKQCIGYIGAINGMNSIFWVNDIPSVTVIVRTPNIAKEIESKNGKFWGLNNNLSNNNQRVLIPEYNILGDVYKDVEYALFNETNFKDIYYIR